MFTVEHPSGPGRYDGPVPPDQWKRAVLRPPPTLFSVEVLPPIKLGGNYRYGMRILPLSRGSRASLSSSTSYSEYEIWRRWEDCLWFQDALELEYRRAARQKRQRLLQGKGVKKGDFYMQDRASSWESLPPGPDPNSVAREVHEYIPRLTKKGTIFRASQATIDQRRAELTAMVEALLSDDQPALVKELVAMREISDFFGFWQRDQDHLNKTQKRPEKPRSSITASVLSSYFSASNTNVSESDTSSHQASPTSSSTSRFRTPFSSGRSTPSTRPSTSSGSSISASTLIGNPSRPSTASGHTARARTPEPVSEPRIPTRKRSFSNPTAAPGFAGRPRAFSTTSTDSSSGQSSARSESPIVPVVPIVVDDVPIVFGHNPYHPHEERPLQALPEDAEGPVKCDPNYPPIVRRRRGNSVGDRLSGGGQTYGESRSPPRPPIGRRRGNSVGERSQGSPTIVVDAPRSPVNRSIPELPSMEELSLRHQSMRDSNATILQGFRMTLNEAHRASFSSVASFMTDCSADAVLPRTPNTEAKFPTDVGDSRPTSTYTINGDWREDDRIDPLIFDAFPIPTSFIPRSEPDSRPETPVAHFESPAPALLSSPAPSAITIPPPPPSPPSPPPLSTSALFSTGPSSGPPSCPDIISIKAVYNNSIIMLRAPREITLKEVRERLYKKFVGQEGVPLPKSFTLSYAVPTPEPASPGAPTTGRARSGSVSSITDRTQMKPVSGEDEWELILYAMDGSKLNIRICDAPA